MKKIKEYRRDLQKEVRIAFADGGEWGDRWEQWETILRQVAEDVREECAMTAEMPSLECDCLESYCHNNDAVRIRSIKIE